MIENIKNAGFLSTEDPNEYVKGNWIIRLEDEYIEVFSNPDKVIKAMYYYGKIDKVDIDAVLQDIEYFDLEEF
jgi:hypothetical protein